MKHRNDVKTELHYFIALINTTNLIFKFGSNLLKLFPNIEDLFLTSTNDLIGLGLPSKEVMKLKEPDWNAVEQDLRWSQKQGNYIMTIKDSSYPPLLKEILNPPLMLFISGDLQLLKSPQIAIIGSRNPSPAGSEIAFDFAKELVQSGFVVTSGFAAGIDAAGHRGAIAGLGKTVAVMGTGLNHLYPSYHSSLAQKILDIGGVLLSEFPLRAESKPWHFPLRNRIISGLSVGTLVVEATIRSGSLITARLASEQGREIFAIPGSIRNPLARGSHYLIQQGAKLVESPADILEEFIGKSWMMQTRISNTKNCQEKNKLDREHKKLLDCIGFEVTSVDILVARIDLPVPQINAMLLELELRGLIRAVMGGYTLAN